RRHTRSKREWSSDVCSSDLSLISDFFDEDDEHELIKESEVHYFMGISKEDAKHLIKDHPDIPHIKIKDNVYYPQGKLREWMKNRSEERRVGEVCGGWSRA